MFTPLTLWLKEPGSEKCVCVAERRPLRVLRLQKRETCTFEFVLVWVYFERKGFESGFRDSNFALQSFTEGNAKGVQSLVLSPLISDVFADVFTGLVFGTDSPSEGSSECTHFSSDETVCNVSIFGLQCLEENRPFCTCGNCMLVSEEFGANLGRWQLLQFRLNCFLTICHNHVKFLNLSFSTKPKPFLFLTVTLHVHAFLTNLQTLKVIFVKTVMKIWSQLHVNFGIWTSDGCMMTHTPVGFQFDVQYVFA